MTTILAYRDAMYADSSCTDAGTTYTCEKIFKVGSRIIGCSGAVVYINDFIRQMRRGVALSKLRPTRTIGMDDDDPEFAGLLLSKHGLYTVDNTFGLDKVHGLYHAIGSGRKAVLGAVHMMKLHPGLGGIDPALCIEAACRADAYSRLPIQRMTLAKMELEWL